MYLNIHAAEGDTGRCHLVLEAVEASDAAHGGLVHIQVRSIAATPHKAFCLGGHQFAVPAHDFARGCDVKQRAVKRTALDFLEAEYNRALVRGGRIENRLEHRVVQGYRTLETQLAEGLIFRTGGREPGPVGIALQPAFGEHDKPGAFSCSL